MMIIIASSGVFYLAKCRTGDPDKFGKRHLVPANKRQPVDGTVLVFLHESECLETSPTATSADLLGQRGNDGSGRTKPADVEAAVKSTPKKRKTAKAQKDGSVANGGPCLNLAAKFFS